MTARTGKPIFDRWNFFGTVRPLVRIQSSRPGNRRSEAKLPLTFFFAFTKSVKAPKRRRLEPNSLDDAGRQRLLAALDGMADTQLTLNVYASADPKARQQAAEVIAQAMAER